MNKNRRFTVEEVDNGWLLKVSELGSDKLTGRFVFTALSGLYEHLIKMLDEKDKS